MLTGPNGEILEQYDYDAFGFPYFYDGQGNAKTFFDTPSNSVRGYSPYGNRFLFTGREWLTDLKLYDYRNRIYHPELGRFLQPDPKHFTAGDYNLYRYCKNDPVNKSDPTGLAPGDSYSSVDQAAIHAVRDINETSIALGIEYSGMLYRMPGGSFSYTAPVPGGKDWSRITQRIPAQTTFEGNYHTHGRYDPPHDYHNFIFSERDRRVADGWNRTIYLGNPAREVRKYTPNLIPLQGKSEIIATSYPLPPPPPQEDRTFQDLLAPFKKFW